MDTDTYVQQQEEALQDQLANGEITNREYSEALKALYREAREMEREQDYRDSYDAFNPGR